MLNSKYLYLNQVSDQLKPEKCQAPTPVQISVCVTVLSNIRSLGVIYVIELNHIHSLRSPNVDRLRVYDWKFKFEYKFARMYMRYFVKNIG